MLRIRVSEEEEEQIKKKTKENGFRNVSEYIRYVALNAVVKMKVKDK